MRTLISICLPSLILTSTLLAEVVDATVKVINKSTKSYDLEIKTPLSVDIDKTHYNSFNVERVFLPAQRQPLDWQSIDPMLLKTKIYIDNSLQTPYTFVLKSTKTEKINTQITTESTIKLTFNSSVTNLNCTVFDNDNDKGASLDCDAV